MKTSPTAATSSKYPSDTPPPPHPPVSSIDPTLSSLASPPPSTLLTSPLPLPSEMLAPPSSAPTYVGLQACICDMEHKCIDPFVVHSSLIICLSSDGPLRKIKGIKSLNISHGASGTIFKVILPIDSLSNSAGAIIGGGVFEETSDVAMSPWASVKMTKDQTQMIVRLEPGGLAIWFELFAGSIIEIFGQVQIEEEGRGEENLDGSPSPPTRLSFDEFHISAILAEQPSQSPFVGPSVGSIVSCICNSANLCYSYGDVVESKRSRVVRICLFRQHNDRTSVEIRVTYLKLQQEGDGVVFEAVTEGGAISSLVTIDTDMENMDLAIDVELLPAFFVKPATIKIYGLGEVTDILPPTNSNVNVTNVSWELSIAVEGTGIILPVSPSLLPIETSFTLDACRCDKKNNCLQDALVKIGDADPELRICIVAKDISTGNALSEIELNSLTITQQETGMVLTLKDKDYGTATTKYDEVSEDGKTIITLPRLSLFFLAGPPVPAIVVEGSAKAGASFLLMIPLHREGIPGGSDGSIVQELPFAPSSRPSISVKPSVTQDPGIKACLCNPELIGKETQNTCVEKSFSKEQNDVYVCILTRPQGVELVSAVSKSFSVHGLYPC